jgi:transposase InsO family protein
MAICAERPTTSAGRSEVTNHPFDLLVLRGIREHIRSDNGPEFTARKVRRWLSCPEVQTLFIRLGSPRENGYIESFSGKLSD